MVMGTMRWFCQSVRRRCGRRDCAHGQQGLCSRDCRCTAASRIVRVLVEKLQKPGLFQQPRSREAVPLNGGMIMETIKVSVIVPLTMRREA